MKKTDQVVQSLQDELGSRQKTEFTEWINSILQEEQMKVEDLFLDLSDGHKLKKLLELVSGEKLTSLVSGKSRMHNIENVGRCLAFLRTKVSLPSIGAQDIVDGNHRLILGLVWTIMHCFPPKIENAQEIPLTPPPKDEQATVSEKEDDEVWVWILEKPLVQNDDTFENSSSEDESESLTLQE